MPASWQKFKFGPIEKELRPDSSRVPRGPSFISVDRVLKAFGIPEVDRFEADGKTVVYARDANGALLCPKRILCLLGSVIHVVYKTPLSSTSSLESTIAFGRLVSLNASVDRLSIKSNVSVASDASELQKHMGDQPTLMQSKTKAILTQQLGPAEHPIPRLFIVLPEAPLTYDPVNWFRSEFRLHFICECGRHTEANYGKAHHPHLAKHKGYLVHDPIKFFQEYGPFLLLMLQLIKDTYIAGHVVPPMSRRKPIDLGASVQQTANSVTAKIDYSLECIIKQMSKVQALPTDNFIDTGPQITTKEQDLDSHLRNVKGLKGVQLRQLKSYIRTSEEENLFGNIIG